MTTRPYRRRRRKDKSVCSSNPFRTDCGSTHLGFAALRQGLVRREECCGRINVPPARNCSTPRAINRSAASAGFLPNKPDATRSVKWRYTGGVVETVIVMVLTVLRVRGILMPFIWHSFKIGQDGIIHTLFTFGEPRDQVFASLWQRTTRLI